jgi:hypothetical protein
MKMKNKRTVGVIMSKELKFEYMDYWNVDIILRQRITELSGDTATGKSFIYSIIKDYVQENKINNIKCINKDTYISLGVQNLLDMLKGYRDSIIIIDQANVILRYEEIENYISYDYDSNNYYLLIGRNLPTTARYTEIAKPNINDRRLSIKYIIEPAI